MDRETYLGRLGEDIEPGGRDPAPSPLRVVQQFVNTFNHEVGHARDRLGTPTAASRWLIDHELLEQGQGVSIDDLSRLHELREGLRDMTGESPAEKLRSQRIIDDLGGSIRLAVRLDDDAFMRLEPTGAGVEGVIGSVLAIVHTTKIDGTWQRMKACRQCSWLFFDNSRNRSSGWCSMAVCGNRSKNRSYRRRAGQ